MRKSFCDCCGVETEGRARNFRGLKNKLNVDAGLDTVFVVAGSANSESNICVECFAELLLDSLHQLTETKVYSFIKEFVENTTITTQLREELQERNVALKHKQLELDKTLRVYEERSAKAVERAALDAAEIANLGQQIKLLQATSEARIKLLQSQHAQELEDRENDPEYIASRDRREALRASGRGPI